QRMYAMEYGDADADELNVIEAGKNYGWPAVEGRGSDPKYTNPINTWPTAEASCAGLAYLGGFLVTSCLKGQRMYVMQATDSGTLLGAPAALLEGKYGRLRAAAVAPDG